jgi:hypothetical protein
MRSMLVLLFRDASTTSELFNPMTSVLPRLLALQAPWVSLHFHCDGLDLEIRGHGVLGAQQDFAWASGYGF